MIWDWHGYRCVRQALLHDNVATSLTYFGESMLYQNFANLFA